MDEPQDALVVTSFALSVRNGGNLEKAVNKARGICRKANKFHPEVLDAVENELDESVMGKVLDLQLAVKSSLNAMVDEYIVSQAMSKYPQSPYSDMVSSLLCFLYIEGNSFLVLSLGSLANVYL